jgi:glycosyltransferase involved in cell wall biosynthesis
MEAMPPRIAYFPDSFHEVNGVAHTSRNFVAFARRRGLPMLCVRAGQKTQVCAVEGSVQALELGRSPLAVQLERDLFFDPLFFRYMDLISQMVRAFRPEVIHITGPSELGLFGAYFAWQLKVPLVASWHTNVHEYAARRMSWLTRHTGRAGEGIEHAVEASVLTLTSYLYRYAKVLYAPNPALCALLERKTGRPVQLMQRGVETDVFAPQKRTREPGDGRLVLGYVGRLSVEKNVALLPHAAWWPSGSSWATVRRRRCCAAVCPACNWPAYCVATHSLRPTRIWTCWSSRRTRTPSATWCWRRWPAAFRRWLRRKAGRPASCRTV